MRTVVDIYEHYRIPPWLQLHQLRVAAVGKILADRIPGVDADVVIQTGFFHDMGNILKFDFSPEGPLASLMGDDSARWQSVKDDFAQKYGNDEHHATIAITAEIQVPREVLSCIRGIGFSHMERIRKDGPPELQISAYADMRVGPLGVLSLQERVVDLKERSRRRWAEGNAKDMEEKFDSSTAVLVHIEEDLFSSLQLKPEEINDTSVAPIIEELRRYEV